jgi:hypothetical protein
MFALAVVVYGWMSTGIVIRIGQVAVLAFSFNSIIAFIGHSADRAAH